MRNTIVQRSDPSALSQRWRAALVALVALIAAGCSANETTVSQDAEAVFAETEESSDTFGAGSRSSDPQEADGFFGDSADAAQEEAAEARREDNEFVDYGVRPFVWTDEDNLSTFALDVDTGSYVVARQWLNEGELPPPESVRVEEYLNAFDYDYDAPSEGLGVQIDGTPSPFDEDNVLVRIGVQSEIIDDDDRPQAALTFVIDTSGSMDRDDRLGLVKDSLAELVDQLDRDDTVAIAIYDDRSTVILEPTPARDDDVISDAIDNLRPGGSTNLEAGLVSGYRLAEDAFIEGGINRVILASDGVANAGVTDPDQLNEEISERAINGIQLVTVGFGMGNYSDSTMEQLANQGDGFYAYVDTRDEARRLFAEDLAATAATVAIDGRIQIEFDADRVERYRLIGFENRGVLDDDFRDDDVDAGEVFSGHSVTALYELELSNDVDDRDELGEVRLRWQEPEDRDWVELQVEFDADDIARSWSRTSESMKLATTVAAWAEFLRGSRYAEDVSLDAIVSEANALADHLEHPDVEELAELIERSSDIHAAG